MAVAIVAAIVAQLAKTVGTAIELDRDVPTTVANFLSFFTILSNAATAVVLGWAAIWFWTRGRRADAEPAALAFALASVTTYMVITGVVYNLLLRHIELPQEAEPIPWSNEIMHSIGPLFLLVDLFIGPLRRALPWKAALGILIFPIVWVVYTLVRGTLTTNPVSGDPWWYPYPFLDPHNPNLVPLTGYPGVAIYIVAIAVAIIVTATLVVWVGRVRGRTTVSPAESRSSAFV